MIKRFLNNIETSPISFCLLTIEKRCVFPHR